MKSFDQLVNAPKVDRNPFNPVADRKSVNGYDHIMDSLRTAALKRDAALAGGRDRRSPGGSGAGEPATDKPPTVNEFGEAYVRNAIAHYQRNSSLTP